MGNLTYLNVAILLAWKSLVRNKSKTFLTLFILSLGFISSIIVYGVLKDTGYRMEQDFIDTNFGDITLEPFDHDLISSSQSILRKIDVLPNILGAAAVRIYPSTLTDEHNNSIQTNIWVVDPEDFSRATTLSSLVTHGEYLGESSEEIFIGCLHLSFCTTYEESMPVLDSEIGEVIKVTIKNTSFPLNLKGAYKHQFTFVENVILVNQKTAERYFPDYNKDQSNFIILKLPNREMVENSIYDLAFLGLNVKLNSWKDKLNLYTSILNSFNVVGDLSFIIGIIISAASVYIILYIHILHRRVQIGVLRAIGVPTKIIVLSYTLQGLIYGVLGSILGVILTIILIGYFKLYPLVTGIGNLIPNVGYKIYLLVSLAIIISSTFTGLFIARRLVYTNIINMIRDG